LTIGCDRLGPSRPPLPRTRRHSGLDLSAGGQPVAGDQVELAVAVEVAERESLVGLAIAIIIDPIA
jgi:hypothetical protein